MSGVMRELNRSARRVLAEVLPGDPVAGATWARHAGWRPDRSSQYCRRCGVTASEAAMTASGCPECRDRPLPWDGVWRLGAYCPPLSDWIVQMKFARAWPWAETLGRWLARRTPVPRDTTACVVPVPLHWGRRVRRGYDQAAMMARAFAAAKNLPLVPAIRRRRATRPQSGATSVAERKQNLRHAFEIASVDFQGAHVWLVDDVCTTGMTAGCCATLLRRAGASRIDLVVPAVADPWSARPSSGDST